MKLRIMTIAALAACLALLGCGTSGEVNIEKDWKNPAYNGGKAKRILIVALTGDPALRQDLEQSFAGKLVEKGINGISGRTLIPDPKQVNREAIKAIVDRDGIDAVLVIRGMGMVDTGVHSNAADWFMRSEMAYYNSFYNYWDTATTGVFTMGVPPGGMQQYVTFRVEAMLYETKGGTPVYSSLTKATSSREVGETKRLYVEAIVKSLGRNGLI